MNESTILSNGTAAEERGKTIELLKMKQSRKRPKQHDIFVIQPSEMMFIFGSVAKTNIENKDNIMVNGWNLIYVYNLCSTEKKLPDVFKPEELLIPPVIVNNQGWLRGFFETVGNDPTIDNSIAEGYGFFNFLTKKFVNDEGASLNFQPRKWADYGLGSFATVAAHIGKEIETTKLKWVEQKRKCIMGAE